MWWRRYCSRCADSSLKFWTNSSLITSPNTEYLASNQCLINTSFQSQISEISQKKCETGDSRGGKGVTATMAMFVELRSSISTRISQIPLLRKSLMNYKIVFLSVLIGQKRNIAVRKDVNEATVNGIPIAEVNATVFIVFY
ncbi:hypothetical protein TorRG33x02_055900 [Trema orientale]|uniref:Uncharacterized protein n=1 Tax=Trema orientale TaxID=63057 RepID=A0A2P5FLL3_TREOI|nr:hypothetical protein TorRG33x02_055900 [Trema orientale]